MSDATLLGNVGTLLNPWRNIQETPPWWSRASAYCRAAIAATPAHHFDLAIWQTELSEILWDECQLSGDLHTVNEAVMAAQEASRRCPPEHIQVPHIHTRLALALRERYNALGDPDDWMTLSPRKGARWPRPGTSAEPGSRSWEPCSCSLAHRALVTGTPADLDEVISLAGSAAEEIHWSIPIGCIASGGSGLKPHVGIRQARTG